MYIIIIYVYLQTQEYARMHEFTHAHIHTHVHTCVHTYMHVGTYTD